MLNREARLVVLSAPSGAGKSTLASMLLQKYPAFRLSISHTTRAPRGAEQNGTHYFFVTEALFQAMIVRKEFLEYASVFGKYNYGTSRSFVEQELASGRNVLFDIDVQGARSLKKTFGDRCITVFIFPPSLAELEKRLRNRKTESDAAIAARLQEAQKEMNAADEFDYQLTNTDLAATFAALEGVLRKEQVIGER